MTQTIKRWGRFAAWLLGGVVTMGMVGSTASAQFTLTNGDFEATPFDDGWAVVPGVSGVVQAAGIAPGSTQAAQLSGNAEGNILFQGTDVQGDWLRDFDADYYFQINSALGGNRSLNMQLRYGDGQGEAINARIDSTGSLQLFTGSWETVVGSESFFAADQVYRIKFEGRNWGEAAGDPTIGISWSNAGGTTFDNVGDLSGLNNGGFRFTPQGSISAVRGERSFSQVRYLDAFQSSGDPSFIIDDVTVTPVAAPADNAWAVDASGNWSASANWDSNPSVPGVGGLAGGTALLNTAVGADTTVTLDTNVDLSKLSIANSLYDFTVDGGGTLTLSGGAEVRAEGNNEGHTISATIAGSAGLVKTGDSRLVISGNNTYTGLTDIQEGGIRLLSTTGINGDVTIAAGADLVFQGDDLGGGYNGTFAGDLQGAGQVTLSQTLTTETVTLNAAKTHAGLMRVSSGTLAVSHADALGAGGTNDSRTRVDGGSAEGTLAVSGGIDLATEVLDLRSRSSTNADAHVTSDGANTISGDIDGRGGNTRYNLESTSGTLTLAGRLTAPDDGGSYRYVFDGAGDFNLTGMITDDDVKYGDPVDPDGTRVASANANISVVKRGSGTLTVDTATANLDDYWRGTTTIEQGAVVVLSDGADGGELATTTTIQVQGGATLDTTDFGTYFVQIDQGIGGAGTVQANTLGFLEGSTMSPGDSVGTLTINGSLNMLYFDSVETTVPNTGALNFELGDNPAIVGGAENDLVSISGNLNISETGTTPATDEFTVNVEAVEGALGAGSYRLIDAATYSEDEASTHFTPVVVDNLGNTLNIRQGVSIAVDSGNADVNLVVSGSASGLTWSGGSTGAWDVAAGADFNGDSEQFFDLDHVTFDNTGPLTVNIGNAVAPGSVTFANTAGNDYTVSGAAINGSGTLDITGGGNVTLANDGNRFEGKVTIGAGSTLTLGDGSSNLDTIGGDNAIEVNGTLELNDGNGETLNGDISGAGGVTVTASGLTLGGDNTYTGATHINASVLTLTSATGLGSTAGGTNVAAGARLDVNGQAFTLNENVTLNGGEFRAGGGTDSNLDMAGAITVGSADSTIGLNGDTDTFDELGVRATNGLTVSGNITGAAGNALTTRVDGGSTLVISGAVSHDGDLNKTNGGTLEISGSANHTGDTHINGGTLAVVGSGTIGSSPNIHVNFGGVLDVTGTTSGGITLSNQTLTVDGDVEGNVTATGTSVVNVNSDTSLAGDLTLQAGTKSTGAGRVVGSLTAEAGATVQVGGEAFPLAEVVLGTYSFTGTGAVRDLTATDADGGDGISFSDMTIGAGMGDLTDNSAPDDMLRISGNDTQNGTGGALTNDALLSFTITVDAGFTADLTALEVDNQVTNAFNYASSRVYSDVQGNDEVVPDTIGRVGRQAGGSDAEPQTDVVDLDIPGGNPGGGVNPQAADFDLTGPTTITFQLPWIDASSLATRYADLDEIRIKGRGTAKSSEVIDLTVGGNYTQQAGANLQIDINAQGGFDKLNVLGTASLGGGLAIDQETELALGDEMVVVTSASISGSFDNAQVTGTDLTDGNTAIAVLYEDTGVDTVADQVRLYATYRGDANGDGTVSLVDLNALGSNFGTGTTWQEGDFNYDGVVSLGDLNFIGTNFGSSITAPAPAPGSAPAVPEPASLMLLGLGGLALSRKRRG